MKFERSEGLEDLDWKVDKITNRGCKPRKLRTNKAVCRSATLIRSKPNFVNLFNLVSRLLFLFYYLFYHMSTKTASTILFLNIAAVDCVISLGFFLA